MYAGKSVTITTRGKCLISDYGAFGVLEYKLHTKGKKQCNHAVYELLGKRMYAHSFG